MQNRDQRWPRNYRGRQSYEGRNNESRDSVDNYARREKIADRYRSDHDIDVSRSRYDHDESLNRGQDYEYNRDFSNRDYDSRAYSNLSDRSYERPARSAQDLASSRTRLQDDYSPRDNEKHGVMDDIKSFFGLGPKNYKRSDDRIRDDVCEALTYDHDVDASHIEVSVKDAVVTLSGTVTQRSAKRLAEDLAENVRGVSDVRNELQIRNALLDDAGMGMSSSNPATDRLSDKAKNKLI